MNNIRVKGQGSCSLVADYVIDMLHYFNALKRNAQWIEPLYPTDDVMVCLLQCLKAVDTIGNTQNNY